MGRGEGEGTGSAGICLMQNSELHLRPIVLQIPPYLESTFPFVIATVFYKQSNGTYVIELSKCH